MKILCIIIMTIFVLAFGAVLVGVTLISLLEMATLALAGIKKKDRP